MTTDVARTEPSVEELIAQLDPDREYAMPRTGEALSYEQVVAGVRDGTFLIYPGINLPVLRTAERSWALKGSGKPVGESAGPQQAILAQFRRRAVDDFDRVYDEALKRALDPSDRNSWHYVDIFFKYALPRGGESGSMGDTIDALRKFMEAAAQSQERRTVVVDA